MQDTKHRRLTWVAILFAALILISPPVPAESNPCEGLPSYDELKDVLGQELTAGGNEGLGNDMWATVVNGDGMVCAIAFSGNNRSDQWRGSRVISAQKANTAHAFSLPAGAGGKYKGLALSTANLYAAVQPGGSLFGLQYSNPVDTGVAYRGSSGLYGTVQDPMVGGKIGGVNVFGGGLGLYDATGKLVGALGISGDTSCTDHIVAWKVRDGLGLDHVPAGLAPGAEGGTDNIIFDIENGQSASGFGHPTCLDADSEKGTTAALPTTHPKGPNP